jgi:pimeloyl-ACP methyl ester carboxylesterase
MRPVIYCISGLGADERIFKNFKLDDYNLKYIPWLRPHGRESLEKYAQRMSETIKEENAILLGVSFGGMVGIEIAKKLALKKLILVSSIKSVKELPRWMKVAGKFKLNKLVPVRAFKFTERISNYRLGVTTEKEKEMVKAYRNSADAIYVEWAINQVVNWKNDWQPDHIVHIHGYEDKIFPVKNITKAYLIKEGTHLMIYNKANEISKIIMKELSVI